MTERTTKDGVPLIPGREYVLVAFGARLSGMVHEQTWFRGWGQNLPIGSVVRYEGQQPGWGSDPHPREDHWSSEESRAAHAVYVCLKPDEGFWDTRPVAGLIEPVETAVLELDETGLHNKPKEGTP